jgi:hypothetical protein
MNFPDFSLLSFNQLLQHFLLLPDNNTELGVDNLGVEFTPHQRGSLIILDIALVNGLGKLDFLAESLLLKVANGKLIGKSQEVKNSITNVVILKKDFFSFSLQHFFDELVSSLVFNESKNKVNWGLGIRTGKRVLVSELFRYQDPSVSDSYFE